MDLSLVYLANHICDFYLDWRSLKASGCLKTMWRETAMWTESGKIVLLELLFDIEMGILGNVVGIIQTTEFP